LVKSAMPCVCARYVCVTHIDGSTLTHNTHTHICILTHNTHTYIYSHTPPHPHVHSHTRTWAVKSPEKGLLLVLACPNGLLAPPPPPRPPGAPKGLLPPPALLPPPRYMSSEGVSLNICSFSQRERELHRARGHLAFGTCQINYALRVACRRNLNKVGGKRRRVSVC
jgi:hypothetical protein